MLVKETNDEIIIRLQQIGPLPDDSSPGIDGYPLEEFDALVQQLTEPLAPNHSLALINLGPPRDASAFEVEWSLIHAAESIIAKELQSVLLLADDTEVRRIIEIRLANYLNSNPQQ